MEERIKNLENHVQKLRNIVWVVGVIALIFGVSGGWGIKTLNTSKDTIKKLGEQIDQLNNSAHETEETLIQFRKREEAAFGKYVVEQKSILNEYIQGAIVPFESKECPSGWVEYENAYGRFIRGIDKSQVSVDPEGQREPGKKQPDMSVSIHKVEGGVNAMPATGEVTVPDDGSWSSWAYVGTAGPGDANFRLRKNGGESRPKNVALLYCIKI